MKKEYPDRLIRVLSCGAGVQSSAILIMSCIGVLEKLDYVIFSDTGWEPKAVYENLDWLKKFSEKHEIPFTILKGRNIRDENIEACVKNKTEKGQRYAALPLFTLGPDGSIGQIRRQCTRDYKVRPIQKFIRRTVLGLEKWKNAPKYPVVEHWFGITIDEVRRCRMSSDKWAIYRYPLIEDFEPPMSRSNVVNWFKENKYPVPPRSACIGCTYKKNKEWRNLKENHPNDWADAVEFDKSIRWRGGMEKPCFLHRSCVPLDEVDLKTPEEKGQGSLFDTECSGLCGV